MASTDRRGGERRPPKRLACALAVALAFGAAAAQAQAQAVAPPSEADLAKRLDALAAELARVKAELARLQADRAASAGTTAGASAPPATSTATAAPTPIVPAPAAAAPVVAAAPSPSTALGPGIALGESTVLTSYGEANYNRPTNRSRDAVADLRRFVLGFQHRFDEKTKVVTELEVEHAVSSSDDPGEVEVEQAYIERQLSTRFAARAGLFLIPAGLLNENHEPTAYYGVERNFVETAIIPSTWREGGLQVVWSGDSGLTAQGGVTTGFDLTKWDAASTEGAESPLGSIHQELALARARDLSVFGALNWRGVPGLLVGGSVFTGGATHKNATTSSRVTLWDLHARWTPGAWDLSALYARGTISNTGAFNTALVGNPTLVPKSFDGWYGQAAYKVWTSGDYALTPFVRYERFNTGRAYADLGPGLTPADRRTEHVVTAGANFYLGPSVVLKADYQRFRTRDADRVDLGIGYSF